MISGYLTACLGRSRNGACGILGVSRCFEVFVYITLINPNILDDEFGWQVCLFYRSPLITSQGEIQDNVVWVMKRIFGTPLKVGVICICELSFIK